MYTSQYLMESFTVRCLFSLRTDIGKQTITFFATNNYLSNRKCFSCLHSLYKHERSWENSRQLCKPETKSRVCITVENSPNASSVYIRLCKHRKKVFYCFYTITFPRKKRQTLCMALIKREILTSRKILSTKS